MKKSYKYREIFSSLIFYLAILVFIIGFNFTDTPPPFGWYQQWMPNLNGANITDITFTDSLNGYAVTSLRSSNDSAYILKTTNGGDNWSVKFMHNKAFVRVEFINANTGFTNAFTKIFKTTNAGENWTPITLPSIFGDDMFVLNQDTIWLAMSEPFTGGVYFTSTGGASWDRQFDLGSANPSHIYMFNASLGFIATGAGLYRTTNGGVNWLPTGGGFFMDMYFADDLTGWKNNGTGTIFQKTTDGGLNWVTYSLPLEQGYILLSRVIRFSNAVRDTIWGAGPVSSQSKALIYKSTNGGINFGYQILDSSINIFQFQHSKFIDRLKGWEYTGSTGVHTVTGGNDTTWYYGIQKISNNIPKSFILKQNYPNPFNPRTIIPYSLKSPAYVRLIAYDILGREVQKMVDLKQTAGEYEVDFMGKFTSTGVYFYRIQVTDDKGITTYSDTKKMILLK